MFDKRTETVVSSILWVCGLVFSVGVALGAGESGTPPAAVKREIIPGSELMTPQERERYRHRMRGVQSEQDRERYRAEHTKRMQERARLRGLQLSEPFAGGTK